MSTENGEATSPQTQSGITPTTLQQTLVSELGATHVDIEDISGGCGQAFSATIVSAQFAAKKTTLARHRLVNAALKEQIKLIHAWSAKCYTPEEWEAQNARMRQARDADGTGGATGAG